jgi:hypothetical protein
MKTLSRKYQYHMEYLAALNAFCLQLNEFCLLFQREILRQPDLPFSSVSAESAHRFAETLMLCPTAQAAQISIRRDLTGARSLLVAAEGVLRRIRGQIFQFASECPAYQTRFYLLACAVEEILSARYQEVPGKPAPPDPDKVAALP